MYLQNHTKTSILIAFCAATRAFKLGLGSVIVRSGDRPVARELVAPHLPAAVAAVVNVTNVTLVGSRDSTVMGASLDHWQPRLPCLFCLVFSVLLCQPLDVFMHVFGRTRSVAFVSASHHISGSLMSSSFLIHLGGVWFEGEEGESWRLEE